MSNLEVFLLFLTASGLGGYITFKMSTSSRYDFDKKILEVLEGLILQAKINAERHEKIKHQLETAFQPVVEPNEHPYRTAPICARCRMQMIAQRKSGN